MGSVLPGWVPIDANNLDLSLASPIGEVDAPKMEVIDLRILMLHTLFRHAENSCVLPQIQGVMF